LTTGARTLVREICGNDANAVCLIGPAPMPRRHHRRSPPKLAPWQEHRAKETMRARLNSEIAMVDVAQICKLSLSHFVRAFSNTVGIAPYRWFLSARVEHAKGLLIRSALPLAQIALECGFSDQSHFTNTFVRHVAMTPGRWRRTYKDGANRRDLWDCG
jgi:AraC family transcriptional regulator